VTDPIRCRSTASGSTAGRSPAVGQRHFPLGAQSGIARYNSYFIPPTLAFLLSLLLRLGQWSRVSLQQHAVAGLGRETRSPAFPSASRSSAKVPQHAPSLSIYHMHRCTQIILHVLAISWCCTFAWDARIQFHRIELHRQSVLPDVDTSISAVLPSTTESLPPLRPRIRILGLSVSNHLISHRPRYAALLAPPSILYEPCYHPTSCMWTNHA
jgi:hypothetical protein